MSTMVETKERIAAELERAFAESGFAEIGVDGLREATQVSLRTLYKYYPSREAMVLGALERRHARYLAHVLEDLPKEAGAALDEIFERVGTWMSESAPNGCLFHSAVAAHPDNQEIRAVLERHKSELSRGMVEATGLSSARDDLILLHEGLTQCWPLMGERAVDSTKLLAQQLLKRQE